MEELYLFPGPSCPYASLQYHLWLQSTSKSLSYAAAAGLRAGFMESGLEDAQRSWGLWE